MKISFLCLLLIAFLGCGEYFSIKENVLENTPGVDKFKIYKSGVLNKSTPSTLVYEDKIYKVNEEFSSPLAKKFLNALNINQQVKIKFTGGFRGDSEDNYEVVLEDILIDLE